MKKMLEKAGVKPLAILSLLLILSLVGVFHYVFFYHEVDLIEAQCRQMDEDFKSSQWADIEAIIDLTIITARNDAKEAAVQIVDDLNKEYPDLDELRMQFESSGFRDSRFLNTVAKSVKGRYMYDIRNTDNDIFLISRDGIILDMNVTNIDRAFRTFDEEAETHYNGRLLYGAFEKLVSHKDTNLIYYEPVSPNVRGHLVLNRPSRNDLKKIYYLEGLEGLRGYIFLVPAYITDDGDVFGVPDISPTGTVNKNHKIIVVQRFNLYDILDRVHSRTTLDENAHRQQKTGMIEIIRFSTMSYGSIMILDLIALGMIMFYTARHGISK